VSTDLEEQQSSYENQVRYYTDYIMHKPEYQFAGIYADEGISGTDTKKREEFNRMIADCREHKIERIITKSISRFARNTLDCLNYVRELKQLGIGITFEKENIDTLDAKGEVLLTILSSLAQDESRSISENCSWGIRRRFENGQFKMATKRFLGYDNDENGKLVINPEQAKIVVKIYDEYLEGKTPNHIQRTLELEGLKNWNGKVKWYTQTIISILENEKYKGDAILQKEYTVDFLTKKRVKNTGQLKQYIIKDDHKAIIDPLIWEIVQLERKRRETYKKEHGLNSYSHMPETNPFAGKIICGDCDRAFIRTNWVSTKGTRKIWQCEERYRVKGVIGCSNRPIEENALEKAFILAWNKLLGDRARMMEKWEIQIQSGDPLQKYRANQFKKITKDMKSIDSVEPSMLLKTLDNIKVHASGKLAVTFLDGTKIELGK
jgi:DNA invertase Pin-like site-specific DNA recombinase